jgi:hypothetical protein
VFTLRAERIELFLAEVAEIVWKVVSHCLLGKQIEKIAVTTRIAKQINPIALEIIVTPIRC